jgi:hypothetical protein
MVIRSLSLRGLESILGHHSRSRQLFCSHYPKYLQLATMRLHTRAQPATLLRDIKRAQPFYLSMESRLPCLLLGIDIQPLGQLQAPRGMHRNGVSPVRQPRRMRNGSGTSASLKTCT